MQPIARSHLARSDAMYFQAYRKEARRLGRAIVSLC
jgi:hypothetical protein